MLSMRRNGWLYEYFFLPLLLRQASPTRAPIESRYKAYVFEQKTAVIGKRPLANSSQGQLLSGLNSSTHNEITERAAVVHPNTHLLLNTHRLFPFLHTELSHHPSAARSEWSTWQRSNKGCSNNKNNIKTLSGWSSQQAALSPIAVQAVGARKPCPGNFYDQCY